MSELANAVGLGLLIILPIANPLFTVVLFLNLTDGFTASEKNRIAQKTAINAFLLMFIAFYAGHAILSKAGISLESLQTAGGLIVLYVGFRMLFPPAPVRKSAVVQCKLHDMQEESGKNIAFVPLAMPGTAGPGTLSVIISTSSSFGAQVHLSPGSVTLVASIIFLIMSVMLWTALRYSGAITRIIGRSGIDAISRLMGLLLVCLGVQLTLHGIHNVYLGW